jgi:membrane-associated phospholipid phosphatase
LIKRIQQFRKRIVFCLMMLTVLSLPPLQNVLLAETGQETVQKTDRFNKDYLSKFGRDFGQVYTAPKNWDKGDALKFLAVAGTGVLLFAFDQNIQNWVQKRRTNTSDNFFKGITNLGNGLYVGGFLAALYATGEIAGENSLRKTALLSLESWLTSAVFTTGVKFIAGRARPSAGESSHSFHPFSTRSAHNSFPSGHACTAWAVATTIADQTDSAIVDGLAYTLATLVSFSRVHINDHWASDAFIGSAVGYFMAKKVCALNRPQSKEKLSFAFQISRERQALGLSLKF